MSGTEVKIFNIKLVGIREEFAVIVRNKEKQFKRNQYNTKPGFTQNKELSFFKEKRMWDIFYGHSTYTQKHFSDGEIYSGAELTS